MRFRYNPIPNYSLLLGFRNCRKLCITISDFHLLRFSHSFLIHVTLGHFSPSVYDSNFYTMKFSMCAAQSRCPLAASFFILHEVKCLVNDFFNCFLKIVCGALFSNHKFADKFAMLGGVIYRFSADTAMKYVTAEKVAEMNVQAARWWNTLLTSGEAGEAPAFDTEEMLNAFIADATPAGSGEEGPGEEAELRATDAAGK